jgi:phytanoyl-CoA hydroxylase
MTPEQRLFFEEQGYVLISGLIPPEAAVAAEADMWNRLGISRTAPESWRSVAKGHHVFDSPVLLACYTAAFLATAATLAEDDPASVRPPSRAYCINLFPGPGPWQWPRPHIDHAIKEHGHRTFPRAFRIATMTFLHDVAPHGGGTVVWPGSHRAIEALARSDPERYELMWPLNQDLERAGLGAPIELTPCAGDVLFYHYLCAHAGSMNTGDRPRFAMNAKW